MEKQFKYKYIFRVIEWTSVFPLQFSSGERTVQLLRTKAENVRRKKIRQNILYNQLRSQPLRKNIVLSRLIEVVKRNWELRVYQFMQLNFIVYRITYVTSEQF